MRWPAGSDLRGINAPRSTGVSALLHLMRECLTGRYDDGHAAFFAATGGARMRKTRMS
jgi:hypothetical protein